MLIYIVYVFKIILYYLLMYGTYRVACAYKHKRARFPILAILVVSVLYGYYARLIGNPSLISDRGNYAMFFVNQWSVPEPGLDWSFRTLGAISLDYHFLFFSFAFAYMFLTLLSYRFYKEMSPRALFLLLLSSYPIYGYFMLKQIIAQGLAALALIIILNVRWKVTVISNAQNVICIVIAFILLWAGVAFHETAYSMCAVFLCMFLWPIKSFRRWVLVLSPIILLFSAIFLQTALSYVSEQSEALARQTEHYQGPDAYDGFGKGWLVCVKGLPYYIVCFVAIKHRPYYMRLIKDYDKYLFFLLMLSTTILLSFANYWLYRFSCYFYFPAFTFIYLLYAEMMHRGGSTQWFKWVSLMIFALSLKDMVQYYFLYGGI